MNDFTKEIVVPLESELRRPIIQINSFISSVQLGFLGKRKILLIIIRFTSNDKVHRV